MKNAKQHRLQLITVAAVIFNTVSFAQLNNNHRFYIDIGYVGGIQFSNSALVGVYGGAGVFFTSFHKPASIDFRSKELFVTNPEQQATLITLTYRVTLVKGLFFGIGGAHGHQVYMNHFIEEPGSSLAGSNEHIMHGSGYNAEIGYHFKSFVKNKYIGIYPNLLLSYTQVLGHHHNFSNLTFTAGFKIGLKKIL